MPSSTRPATPGPSNVPQSLKRTMSDVEYTPQDSKKARINSSAEPSTRHDSNRDTKRRRRRKKKAPVVGSADKNEATQSRQLDERPRAPLSARNEIVRFTSAPSEANVPASVVPTTKYSSQAPLSKGREGSPQTLEDITEHQSMPSALCDKERNVSMVRPLPVPPSISTEEKIAHLEAELRSKNKLIAGHQALLNQVQQAVTCQVCLDLMYKPYALAPCGHLACHSCLVNWFTAPPPDNRPASPALMRRKTCPHCRAVVRARPVEIWGVKGIAQAVGKSGLLQHQLLVPVEVPECLDANTDPWKDIFPKPGVASHHGFPWFFPDADVGDDDVHIADVVPRGEDVGMLDIEDGGIYRCLDCMHEIWDGVCSSCGRVYPGHRPNGDEGDEGDEVDTVGWLEDQMGAEEVDVADDPGWMGLEEGEADDGGDTDDWRPWRHPFHNMFMRSWGFLGTIHVDEEDDTTYGQVDDHRVADQDEESEDGGYESSFIDDGDEEGEVSDLENGPRIYEIDDDHEDEIYGSTRHSLIVDQVSDEGDEQEDFAERRWPGRRYGPRVVSSDEEEEEEVRAPRFVEDR